MKISEVADIFGGGTPDTNISSFWGADIQWFTPSEVGRDKYVCKSKRCITNSGLKGSSAKLLPPYSILLSSRATIGECSINRVECATNQGFQSLVVKDNITCDFLYYSILGIKEELIKKASGSTFLEISGKEVGKTKIFLPPFVQQVKIANCLSAIDHRISLAKDTLDAHIKQKEYLLRNLFI